MNNPYSVLGLSRNASDEAIHAAYDRRVRELEVEDTVEACVQRQTVADAYEALGTKERRAEVDASLDRAFAELRELAMATPLGRIAVQFGDIFSKTEPWSEEEIRVRSEAMEMAWREMTDAIVDRIAGAVVERLSAASPLTMH